MRFFVAHKQWSTYRPISVVGIVSDFHGGNEFLATETLNLIARRQVQFRVIEKSALAANSLTGLKMVIYADQEPPTRLRGSSSFAGASNGSTTMGMAAQPYDRAFAEQMELKKFT